jgi:hypothetical protein
VYSTSHLPSEEEDIAMGKCQRYTTGDLAKIQQEEDNKKIAIK